MPRITINNIGGGPFEVQDPSGYSSFSMNVEPSASKSADISDDTLREIEDGLNAQQTAGKITWSVADDPTSVADNALAGTVSDGAVTTAKLANLAVTNAKMAAGAALANLADGSVTSAKLATGAALANLADGSITNSKLNPGCVTGGTIAAGVVTKAKTAQFVSTEQTGTGAAQNVAHGLGAVPAAVLIVPTAGDNGAGAAGTQMPTIVEGSHDATNVVVTVAAGAKFKVQAWA